MKKILCLVIILFAGIGIYAQEEEEKAVTGAQFDAIYRSSFDAWSLTDWKGKSFRMVTLTQSRLEGRPQTDFAGKWTVEYASPTSSRMVYETSFGDKKSKTESIRLGEKVYSRIADGDWKESAPKAATAPDAKPADEAQAAEEQVAYKFLGTETLNGQTVRVYEKVSKTKRIKDGQESTTNTATKYWFAEDGSLLKSDMVAETRAGEKIYHTLLSQIWETDETIKIVAPTLTAARKQ